jgi:type II secretory pathway component PulK
MCAQACPYHSSADAQPARLPQTVAAQIEQLRRDRLIAYAEQIHDTRGEHPAPTRLEQSVDDLLDSLNALHRLEQLAEYEARGGRITVDADRLLIAGNEDTYRKLLAAFAHNHGEETVLSVALLPSVPTPID